MAVWRYTGYLMGIPETILFRDAEEALRLHDIGLMCEPSAQRESIVMAHALINSAPIVAGMSDPNDRRKLSQYAYHLTRGLIGDTLANQLEFPKGSSFGVVARFRIEERLNRILRQLSPGYGQKANLNKFTGLLETSLVRRGGHQLPASRPRIRRRIQPVVSQCPVSSDQRPVDRPAANHWSLTPLSPIPAGEGPGVRANPARRYESRWYETMGEELLSRIKSGSRVLPLSPRERGRG